MIPSISILARKEVTPDWWPLSAGELPWNPLFLNSETPSGQVLLLGKTAQNHFPLLLKVGDSFHWNINIFAWLDWIRAEAYRPSHRIPWSARLPFHYHRIPGGIRTLILRGLHRGVRPADFRTQVWVLTMAWLETLVQDRGVPLLCLTHDIDSRAGFAWVKEIAQLEKRMGLRSCWNVVTHHYRIDYELLDWLAGEGFEIGIHGSRHDNRLAFLSEEEMEDRFQRMRSFQERYRVVSFRSPSWLRSARLFRKVGQYFAVDLSTLDWDEICPGGYGGVLSARAFHRGALCFLPCTIPLEVPIVKGLPWREANSYWAPKLAWLKEIGGVALCNTHPEPYYSGNCEALSSYQSFLEAALREGFAPRLPRQFVPPNTSVDALPLPKLSKDIHPKFPALAW